MAHLGELQINDVSVQFRLQPPWLTGDAEVKYSKVEGEITGSVSISAVPTANIEVRAYYRPTGVLVTSVVTDENGDYRFENLDESVDNYYVIAIHDDYDALTTDKITPAAV